MKSFGDLALAALLPIVLAVPSTAFAGTAKADVWRAHPSLLCQGEEMQTYFDDGAKTNKSPSRAVWIVDFEKSQVRYANMNQTEVVVSKFYEDHGSYDTAVILLSSGRLMRFFASEQSLDTVYFPAKLVDASEGMIDRINFRCFPR